MTLADPLSPKPTVRLDGYSGSDGDGAALRRTSEDRPLAIARAAGRTTRMRPGPRSKKARRLFSAALRKWRAGQVFDARADVLLAQVFDPDNKTYRSTAERWERSIRDALS